MNTSTRKAALITGASGGIGAVYADRLGRRGYDLILVARDAGRLTAVAESTTRHGVAVETIRADLTKVADLRRVEERLRTDSAISMLVNNAGIGAAPGLADADIDALDRMIHVNVAAPTRLAAAAASAFSAAGRGTIVNISSALALAPELFSGAYSGTKAYILNLTISLRQEMAPRGVQVQAVLPGATRTAFWGPAGESLPAKMVMEAEELVDAALAGLDMGEDVTIPSLPDRADWDSFDAARSRLGPNLSRQHAAARYGQAA
ncbi:SDR family oxidoreductase [Bradyrhizobium sp. Arg237L]|uniref:SDR family NAD(P)-dependent oxidoreductase n=2 Tax=unclassified Bradyrhizobium TaxID=2631580 RepID=UPI00249E5A1F|nr:SDR family oxidoreductase [Bradyrhizobium sp. Arg237L]MDI4237350.1 SDR family oxidoreductase [Bradyrhizobium sp. Arg237L]